MNFDLDHALRELAQQLEEANAGLVAGGELEIFLAIAGEFMAHDLDFRSDFHGGDLPGSGAPYPAGPHQDRRPSREPQP